MPISHGLISSVTMLIIEITLYECHSSELKRSLQMKNSSILFQNVKLANWMLCLQKNCNEQRKWQSPRNPHAHFAKRKRSGRSTPTCANVHKRRTRAKFVKKTMKKINRNAAPTPTIKHAPVNKTKPRFAPRTHRYSPKHLTANSFNAKFLLLR